MPFFCKSKALKKQEEAKRAKARARIRYDYGVDLSVGRISVRLGEIEANFHKDKWIVPEEYKNMSKSKAELSKLHQSTQAVDAQSLVLMLKNEFLLNEILKADHELKILETKLLPLRKMLDDANERFG